jgi:hypothetical protein
MLRKAAEVLFGILLTLLDRWILGTARGCWVADAGDCVMLLDVDLYAEYTGRWFATELRCYAGVLRKAAEVLLGCC